MFYLLNCGKQQTREPLALDASSRSANHCCVSMSTWALCASAVVIRKMRITVPISGGDLGLLTRPKKPLPTSFLGYKTQSLPFKFKLDQKLSQLETTYWVKVGAWLGAHVAQSRATGYEQKPPCLSPLPWAGASLVPLITTMEVRTSSREYVVITIKRARFLNDLMGQACFPICLEGLDYYEREMKFLDH